MMTTNLKKVILDVIFPHQCICGKWGEPICRDCLSKISLNKKQLCPICKKLSDNGKTCKNCRIKSSLTGALIMADHEGALKNIVWRYKYHFIKDIGDPLGQLLYSKFSDFLKMKKPLITFVPTSRQRINWRGFNQSKLLAESLAMLGGLECREILLKSGRHKSQVGLRRKDRITNISGQIQPKQKKVASLKNTIVLIVDDVYTTGTTLEECAKVVRGLGAKEVWGMVLSRD